MLRCLYFLTVLALAFCPLAAAASRIDELNAQAQEAYNTTFVGKTRDQLIAYYGTPSHTVKLDNGGRILEYASKRLSLLPGNHRSYDSCNLRFWMNDGRVARVDDTGLRAVCLEFATTKNHSQFRDLRY